MNTNDRDMFYSGYYGMAPMPNMQMNPNMQMQTPNMMNPSMTYSYDNNYNNSNYNNLENRLTRIENQIKLINQRLTRLETPYSSTTYNNEPDSNMYMM